MEILNFEFKAKCNDLAKFENQLKSLHPVFIGEDLQTDTYFNTSSGRLKLREGNIENALIYYQRSNLAGGKQSDVILYHHLPDRGLKEILTRSSGVKIIVRKKRKIYFLDNVKFHFDSVEGLGNFVEVEAIDENRKIGIEKLKEQCDGFAHFFEIAKTDFIDRSYSDLLLEMIG